MVLFKPHMIGSRTDLIARFILAAVVVLGAVRLGSGTGALIFIFFLLDMTQPDARYNALLVGSAYALAVLSAPLLPFDTTVAIALLAGAFNTLLGLGTYTRSLNKKRTLAFTVASVGLVVVGLLLGLSEVPMSVGRSALLFLLVVATWWGFASVGKRST